MGDKQSRPRGHSVHDTRPKSASASQPTPERAEKKSAPVTEAVPLPPENCDVIVTCANNPEDIALAKLVKGGLESASIPVYQVSNESKEAAKAGAQAIVDAKMLVFIVSEASAACNKCQDHVSLSYISNKPIIGVGRQDKEAILDKFNVGMKLTMQTLHWFVFSEESDDMTRRCVQFLQEQLNPAESSRPTSPEASVSTSTVVSKGRLNTKLRAQSTVRDLGGEEPQINTFWDRNFSDEDEVPWYKFQQAFLTDYEPQLSGLFDERNIPWLLGMLKDDVFSGAENITKGEFMKIRGDSPDKNAFWRVISHVAIEKFNMREVFNMNSTVRLTAIEKLAAFQNPAVIEALMRLLQDPEPNVRAVAAISLGRTGKSTEEIVDKLIALLKDGDRIVRQSACLSLGTLKAAKAIPAIGDRWRNDFISVVRNAARTALENMDIPEAKDVLQVTKVLEDEIESLAGKQVAV